MIGESDRLKMRQEAERVERSTSTFTDSHLMAVFVVTLLDDMEAGEKRMKGSLDEEEAARIADEAVREVREEMAAETSGEPLLPAPTPEEVLARREARRRSEEAWGESYGGSDPSDEGRR